MRDLFNETFEKETMPDCSKRRVRNHLLEVFDEVQKPKKKRGKKLLVITLRKDSRTLHQLSHH